MAKSKGNGIDQTAAANSQEAQAALTVVGQYVKDLSFETPNPVKVLFQGGERPHFDINVEAKAAHVVDRNFEVGIHIKVNCSREEETVFILELMYAGLFAIGADVPEEYIRPILMVECPRILFPFARSLVASTIQESGFPPLMLTPIDFAGLYQQQLQQEQTQGQTESHPLNA